MVDDVAYMKRAIALAKLATGHTSPNPLVGAVVVKDNTIIGEGYHHKAGTAHAEVHALNQAGDNAKGATLYVTLEPCSHYGKTPPCTEALIEAGIKKVYVGNLDPNPKVAGGGIKILNDHGIETETGILEEECRQLNDIFFHYIQNDIPYTALKYAMTLDGKIATATGESKWITGEEARRHVHTLRHQYAAIMAGIGTVLADDPMLNARIEHGNDPIRVICDSNLRISEGSNIVKTAREIPTIIATISKDQEKIAKLERLGIFNQWKYNTERANETFNIECPDFSMTNEERMNNLVDVDCCFHRFLAISFPFNGTPEGVAFWNDIAKK